MGGGGPSEGEEEGKKEHRGRKEGINYKNEKLVHRHFNGKLVLPSQLPNWQSFLMTFQSSLVMSAETLDFTNQTNDKINMLAFLHIQEQKK